MRGKFLRNPASLDELEALRPHQFLRSWISRNYRKEEEEAHAENDWRDEQELKKLIHIGVYRDWTKKRLFAKSITPKKKRPAKKTAVRHKKD